MTDSVINSNQDLSNTEMAQLIHLIKRVHGFDFSQYSAASFKRRILRIIQLQKISLFELRSRLTNDADYFEHFLTEITVNVTEMFRDPSFFKSLRNEVLPYLGSYQNLKVWNAGCSSGEELYAFAILFKEESLYNRAFFYGTDINSIVIDKARAGKYDLRSMKLYSGNYKESGGKNSLSQYYSTNHEAAFINENLKKNTLFSIHNLVSDGVFNEFHIISCRNVLIYFNETLQEKVTNLFVNSLTKFGFLCLGSKESLKGEVAKHFKIIDKRNNIYQKIT